MGRIIELGMITWTPTAWARSAIAAACVAFAFLCVEHVLPHGPNLIPPEHHWLSEYVLSSAPGAASIMRIAFVALATTAWLVSRLQTRGLGRAVFVLGSLGLGAMTFFDTDPIDGKRYGFQWPLTHGNMHQLLLYVAMGAVLAGIALTARHDSGSGKRRHFEMFLLGLAVLATVVQTVLVTISRDTMTYFGGLTERVIVVATLAWVVSFSLRKSGKR
jgi:hypothetical protein